MNVRERHCKNNIRKDRHIVSPHIGRRAKLGKRNCQQGYELRKGPVWKQHQTDFKNEEGVGGAFQKKREKGGELKAKRSAANQSWWSDREKQKGEAQEE
jgi:hypothetical protein